MLKGVNTSCPWNKRLSVQYSNLYSRLKRKLSSLQENLFKKYTHCLIQTVLAGDPRAPQVGRYSHHQNGHFPLPGEGTATSWHSPCPGPGRAVPSQHAGEVQDYEGEMGWERDMSNWRIKGVLYCMSCGRGTPSLARAVAIWEVLARWLRHPPAARDGLGRDLKDGSSSCNVRGLALCFICLLFSRFWFLILVRKANTMKIQTQSSLNLFSG